MSSLCFSRLIIVAVFALTGLAMVSNFGSSSASTESSILVSSQQKPTPEPSPTQSPDQHPTPSPGASGTPSTSNPDPQGAPSPTGAPATNTPTDTGITVGKPKQFDERTLTAMLQDLENKLSRSQFPDPSALYSSTGKFAGATATTTSMGISVRGPSTPSVVTTIGSTTKDTTGSKTVEGTEATATIGGKDPTSTEKATTSNEATTSGETSNTNQQVTTQGGFAPPVAALPGQTSMFSYQPQYGLSAQDLLSEQTSLFYQIVNLRLLLDRSITDRIGTKEGLRDQVVLGFQISIDATHKDAVAEAEITISGTDLSLVSLMPQDKTYNVASVTKDSKAIDMGAVVQFIGVGANIGKTQESLYLVKDTDTVALERPADSGEVKFVWQFRPVLGRRTVEPGSRQVFALLSIPEGDDRQLKVTARTKWRRYDRKAKTVGTLMTGGNDPQYKEEPVKVRNASATAYSLKPVVLLMDWSDIGNGQVMVVAEGDGFTSDTSLVTGNNVLNGPEKGLTVANEKRLIVVTQGHLLAQSPSPSMLIGRYGTTEFVRGVCVRNGTVSQPDRTHPCGNKSFDEVKDPYKNIELKEPKLVARDAQTFEVTVKLVATEHDLKIKKLFEKHKPVVVIGGKVFGLSDAPFIATNFVEAPEGGKPFAQLTFVAPAQLLFDSKKLIFKEFLWNEGQKETTISVPDSFAATAVVTLGSNEGGAQLAIAGRGFKKDKVRIHVGDTLFAADCTGLPKCYGLSLNREDGTATVITLSATKEQIKDIKQILIKQGEAQPVSLPLTLPPPVAPPAKIKTPSEPLFLNEGDSVFVKFQGDNFDSVRSVVFEGNVLSSKPDPDDKTVRWVEVSTVVTGKKGTKRIVFVMKDDKEVPFHIIVR